MFLFGCVDCKSTWPIWAPDVTHILPMKNLQATETKPTYNPYKTHEIPIENPSGQYMGPRWDICIPCGAHVTNPHLIHIKPT